jgi:hypothetical protein
MRRLLALTIIFVAALVVAVGFASAHGPQGNYAQGQSGVGGSWCTCGWNHRHYNRVWHQPGYAWVIHYEINTSPFYAGLVNNTSNPTSWPNEIGYAVAHAGNQNDNSEVLWTAQTTGADVG